MVERSLSMREVPGSIPGASKTFANNLATTLVWLGKRDLHRPGIEPGPPAWQASILPLNQRCCCAQWPSRQEEQQGGTICGKVLEKNVAVGRIRTYAPRGKLISSQSP